MSSSDRSDEARALLKPENNSSPAFIDDVQAEAGEEPLDTRTFWQRWKPASYILVLMGLNYATVIVLQPALPAIKKEYFGSDAAAARYQSILDCCAALVGLATAGVVGKVMDSAGRRPIAILFLFVSALSPALLVALPNNPVPFMVIYSLTIIIQSSFSLAYIADTYTALERPKAYGALKAVEGIMAFTAAVDIALTYHQLAIVSLCLGIGALAWGAFMLKESLAPERVVPFSLRTLENPLKPIRYLTKSKTLIAAVLVLTLYMVTQVGTGEIYLYYLNQRVNFTTSDNSYAFMEAGVLMLIVYLGVMPFLLKRLSPVFVIFISLVALLLELVVIATLWAVWPAFAFAVPMVAMSKMVPPTIYTIVANTGTAGEQGLRMAGLQAVVELAQAAGPLLFGEIFGNVSAQLSFLPFIICAIFVFPAGVLTLKLSKWMREEFHDNVKNVTMENEVV